MKSVTCHISLHSVHNQTVTLHYTTDYYNNCYIQVQFTQLNLPIVFSEEMLEQYFITRPHVPCYAIAMGQIKSARTA